MPGTAAERGLSDPFDPEQAIPKAAELLSELRTRFGNLGLAAAAYNAGPQPGGGLARGNRRAAVGNPHLRRTGHAPCARGLAGRKTAEKAQLPGATCLEIANRIVRDEPLQFARSALTAPWGVQIAGLVQSRRGGRRLRESAAGDCERADGRTHDHRPARAGTRLCALLGGAGAGAKPGGRGCALQEDSTAPAAPARF